MPTYQYRCTECGSELEVVQKFSDAALSECPTCSGQLRKVFNAVGVVFKGSGFYRTDSRKGAGKETADASKVDGAKGEGAKAGDVAAKSGDAAAKSGAAASSGSSGTSASGDSGSSGTAAKSSSGGSNGASKPGASSSTAAKAPAR
jgi:putative FmdB family regulatory protein